MKKTSGVPQGREGQRGEGQRMQLHIEQSEDTAARGIHQLVQASLIILHTSHTCQPLLMWAFVCSKKKKKKFVTQDVLQEDVYVM